MADKLTEQLVARLTELSKIVMRHQAIIFALHDYLREQPGFDHDRLRVLYRTVCDRQAAGTESPDAALLAFLRDFEGPIQ